MKKILLLFSICLTLFLLNLLLLSFCSDLPAFFSSYLNDLLYLPIVLSICYFVIRCFSKNKQVNISLFSAFSLATLYSVYFEYYLPEVKVRYTSDFIDVLLYFAGAFIFWLVQRLESKDISAIKKAA
ncbi:hypothetical protein [Salinimicrobium sp. HB62]|uniref:hypothetical protein n=1 Tax=Salinimicrobium sp. HB62 TaxID=3077781 RepID=UPI002D786BBD|nr:hypothetical protein [Salinimicrobium sp. HB62]